MVCDCVQHPQYVSLRSFMHDYKVCLETKGVCPRGDMHWFAASAAATVTGACITTYKYYCHQEAQAHMRAQCNPVAKPCALLLGRIQLTAGRVSVKTWAAPCHACQHSAHVRQTTPLYTLLGHARNMKRALQPTHTSTRLSLSLHLRVFHGAIPRRHCWGWYC